MSNHPTLVIDGARVKACSGSNSVRGKLVRKNILARRRVFCPECSRSWLAAACPTYHGTPIIPKHRRAAEEA